MIIIKLKEKEFNLFTSINAMREYLSNLENKNVNTRSSIPNITLNTEIHIEKWMIYNNGDVNQDYKIQFIYLLKNLADIPKCNIKWNEDGSITFICKDKPGDGPSDMIFDLKITQKEIFKKIQNRLFSGIVVIK